MTAIAANGINIEYEAAGDPSNPPLLLIMGLGGQLVAWDDDFVDELVRRGYYVVRFDNRDVGLSTWLDDAGRPDLEAMFTGGDWKPAYLLSDMAADTAALLEALNIESAHVVGASMGGMIAQELAIGFPEKVRTLTSIMSTTGNPAVGAPHDEARATLLAPMPPTREEALDASVKIWHTIGSPGFPMDDDRIRAKAGAAFDRGVHPEGFIRQLAAILASPDRTPALKELSVRTLVIHGESDILVDPTGGKATAEAVPGAELWLIPGMGHDLPQELFVPIADRLASHCVA